MDANKTHYEVDSKIRNTIKELGGTMPEDFSKPQKSLKQIEKENKLTSILNKSNWMEVFIWKIKN